MKNNPQFIIIGAAKAGTTSLYKKLNMHPDVFMSNPKEPEFFARDDIYDRGIDWYFNLFSNASNTQVCGEASTLYSLTQLYPKTVVRMNELLPNVKIIYVVREPIKRAFSYYTQLIKNYQNSTKNYIVNRTFEECIFPEKFPNRVNREQFFASFDQHLLDTPGTFIGGGMYMTNIENYLEFYNQENILLIDFDDLVKNIDEVAAKICKFIGVDSSLFPENKEVRDNITSEYFKKIDKEIKKQNTIFKLKSMPGVERFKKIIPQRLRRKVLAYFVNATYEKAEESRPEMMLSSTNQYLKVFYKTEIEQLEKFWHKDLSMWK